MSQNLISQEALAAVRSIKEAEIVIGIPSFQNVRTVEHVVRAAHAGLAKHFAHYSSVIINSDGGSSDGTREAVLSARVDETRLLLLSHPLFPINRLSLPYHGIPGKGSAFRLIFEMARQLGAKACVVVDADLRSITPEWIDLLIRPVLHAGYDFVAPYYHRHKWDGTITNSIVYPLTRALYGLRVRQPIGGDFGLSGRLVERYLQKNDWESDVARYGIDIWMTTVAIAEGFRVCQSFLGAKLHDAKDPAADLSAMLEQVVGSVFLLMERYETVWRKGAGSKDIDLFGFRFDVGLDPIEVNVDRMLKLFRGACCELGEIWGKALQPSTMGEVSQLGACTGNEVFRFEDQLWVRVIYDFASSYHRRTLERGLLLRSLTPLYLARVASFVMETRNMYSAEVEDRLEHVCLCYEQWKPYLEANWRGDPLPDASVTRRQVEESVPAGEAASLIGGDEND